MSFSTVITALKALSGIVSSINAAKAPKMTEDELNMIFNVSNSKRTTMHVLHVPNLACNLFSMRVAVKGAIMRLDQRTQRSPRWSGFLRGKIVSFDNETQNRQWG